MKRTLLVCGLSALLAAGQTWAQDYPSRRITILVGFAAGGPVDLHARLIGERLRERFNQPVIVENRIGGGPQLSFESVKSAPPDGYTLGLATTSLLSLKFTSKTYTPDPLKDFSYIAEISNSRFPQMLTVSTSAPYRTLAEFVSYARANPGKINVGTVGISIEMELATMASIGGFKVTQVPYKGSPEAQRAHAAGEIDATIDAYGNVKPNLDAGKTRALGVGWRERVAVLPDVPAIGEVLPGYEQIPSWFGLIGPAGIPAEVVNRINEAVGVVLRQPDLPAKLEALGTKPVAPSNPQAFRALIAREYERFAQRAALIGLQPQ